LKIAEILIEAGLPKGLYNVIQGDRDTGPLLVNHPDVAKVSLTGSVPTGRKVAAAAAGNLKHVTMELGGKSPLIVFDDADIDSAIGGAMLGNFYSTGQVCSNGTRVFVQKAIKLEFLKRLKARTDAMVIGDPMDEATQVGPMVSWAQREKVLEYIEKGKAEGATLVTGGGIPNNVAGEGYYMQPTVFSDVTDEMTIAREEIFGPVMCVLDFDDEAEVIARANATEFGLAAGVFTSDLSRGHRVVDRLEAGHAVDQHLQSLPGGDPVRRLEAIRLRAREFAGGAGALFGTEDRLCRRWARCEDTVLRRLIPFRLYRRQAWPPSSALRARPSPRWAERGNVCERELCRPRLRSTSPRGKGSFPRQGEGVSAAQAQLVARG
jgi:hypothetical protein